ASSSINQNINRPKGACNLLQSSLEGRAIHHIASNSDSFAPICIDGPRYHSGGLGAAAHHGHLGACQSKALGHHPPKLPAAAGNPGCQVLHIKKRGNVHLVTYSIKFVFSCFGGFFAGVAREKPTKTTLNVP